MGKDCRSGVLRGRHPVVAAASALAATTLLAACGGGSSTGATADNSPATGSTASAASAAAGTTPASSAAASSDKYKGQSLTVFVNGPSGTYADQYKQYYAYLADAFQKATGATLNWQYFTSPAQEVQTIETSTVSGSGPDVIGYGTSFVGTLEATGDFPVLSQSDWAQVGGTNSFFPATLLDSGTTSSNYIGIPYCTFPYTLAYNTKYFKQAGITSPPKTWNDFVQDAQKIQKAVPGVYGTGIDPADGFDPWKNLWLYTRALGGHFVKPDNSAVTLASQPVQDAVDFYFSLYYKFHVVPKQALTWNDAQMGSAFTSGKIAMFPIASETLSNVAKGTALDGNLAFAPLPTMPYGMTSYPQGGEAVETMTTGGYWAIPKYASAKRDLALQFAKISTTSDAQVQAYKLIGYMPVTFAGIQAVEKYDPNSKPFIDAAQNAKATSTSPVWAYVETGLGTAVTNIGAKLAQGSAWSASYANKQLANAQAAANAHIKG